ncbi:hypothetical protein D3C71_1997210 [compost metagenome]
MQLYARAAADAVLEGKAAAPQVGNVREEDFAEAEGEAGKDDRKGAPRGRAPAKKGPAPAAAKKADGEAPAPAAE